MANQHSKNTQAVTYRLDPELVAAVRETAARLGEDQKVFVARALRAELARQETR